MASSAFRRVGLAVTAALTVVLVSGCSQPTIPAVPLGGGPSVTPTDAESGAGSADSAPSAEPTGSLGDDCEADPWSDATPPPTAPLPSDAVLVSATRCLYDFRLVPGDGEWLFKTEQKAATGLGALADALRLPSEQQPSGLACAAVAYPPVILTVTNTAGRTSHPDVPQAACGGPLPAATAAITALPWTTIATTKVRQTRSQAEVVSNCPDAYKPMIALTADDPTVQPITVDVVPQSLVVCRYALDPDPADVISDVGGPPHRGGKFASASSLDTAAGGSLLAAVAAAPPAKPCDKPDAPFAVVQPVDGPGPGLTVELGGCHRVLVDGENYLRQLNSTVVDRLLR